MKRTSSKINRVRKVIVFTIHHNHGIIPNFLVLLVSGLDSYIECVISK